MKYEIERKFLVDMSKVPFPDSQVLIHQGYLFNTDDGVLRVRMETNQWLLKSWLTYKSKYDGKKCLEYEYEIPIDDARDLIKQCPKIISKHRWTLQHGKHTWIVDTFNNNSLSIAEIELSYVDEKFARPKWVTEEVTGDPHYFNSNIAKRL